MKYIDLDLPSDTLWSEHDVLKENHSAKDTIANFRYKCCLPTSYNFEELYNVCDIDFTDTHIVFKRNNKTLKFNKYYVYAIANLYYDSLRYCRPIKIKQNGKR